MYKTKPLVMYTAHNDVTCFRRLWLFDNNEPLLTIGVSVCIKGKKLIYTWMSDVREIILLLILVRIGLFSTVKLVYNGMSCGLVGRSCVYFGRLCMSFGYVCVVRLCVCRLVVLCVGWSCHVRISRSVNNERTHLMCMLFLVHYICRCSNRCHRKC